MHRGNDCTEICFCGNLVAETKKSKIKAIRSLTPIYIVLSIYNSVSDVFMPRI